MAAMGDMRARQINIQLQGKRLARTLHKHHITGIGISGTIGAGLFITSGEIIGIAGSLGAVLSYLIAGLMVICVMLCISEMLSVRPVAGAFFEFPRIYVDPALAFATGWAYWLAYTCSCCTLTVQAAMMLDYWDISVPLGIFICWAPMVFFNFFGPVLWYGNLEWGVKWVKLFIITGFALVSISIAAGVRGNGSITIQTPSINWDQSNLFPRGFCFAGWAMNCQGDGPDIGGSVGAFLGVWTGITSAVFAFIGVEIVIITAGEARYPRHDLPIATRWLYLFAVVVYVLLTVFASLNVSYSDPALLPYGAGSHIEVSNPTLDLFPKASDGAITTGDRSPFVIAAKRAGFTSPLPGLINGCLFFATLTAANTSFYVSSRTLYALCSTGNAALRNTLGRTSYGHLPLNAIAVTIVLSTCSWLGSIKGKQNELVGTVSRISVTSILCVYISECISFIRYQKSVKRTTGMDRDYKNMHGQHTWYRSPGHQPLPAIFAIVFGFLLILFNGWDTFYRASHHQLSSADIAAGLLRSYLGPVLFVICFFAYKKVKKTRLVDYHQFGNGYNPGEHDEVGLDAEPLVYLSGWRQALAEMV